MFRQFNQAVAREVWKKLLVDATFSHFPFVMNYICGVRVSFKIYFFPILVRGLYPGIVLYISFIDWLIPRHIFNGNEKSTHL